MLKQPDVDLETVVCPGSDGRVRTIFALEECLEAVRIVRYIENKLANDPHRSLPIRTMLYTTEQAAFLELKSQNKIAVALGRSHNPPKQGKYRSLWRGREEDEPFMNGWTAGAWFAHDLALTLKIPEEDIAGQILDMYYRVQTAGKLPWGTSIIKPTRNIVAIGIETD